MMAFTQGINHYIGFTTPMLHNKCVCLQKLSPFDILVGQFTLRIDVLQGLIVHKQNDFPM